jgi:hypothetical protein
MTAKTRANLKAGKDAAFTSAPNNITDTELRDEFDHMADSAVFPDDAEYQTTVALAASAVQPADLAALEASAALADTAYQEPDGETVALVSDIDGAIFDLNIPGLVADIGARPTYNDLPVVLFNAGGVATGTRPGQYSTSQMVIWVNTGGLKPSNLAQFDMWIGGEFGVLPSRTVIGATDTLVLTDVGGRVWENRATNITQTIPANADVAFPVDTEIEFIVIGAGSMVLTAASGVSLNGVATGTLTAAQGSIVKLVKRSTDAWWATAGASGTASVTKAVNEQTGSTYDVQTTDANDLIVRDSGSSNTTTFDATTLTSVANGTFFDLLQAGAGASSLNVLNGSLNGVTGGSATVTARWQKVRVEKRSSTAFFVDPTTVGTITENLAAVDVAAFGTANSTSTTTTFTFSAVTSATGRMVLYVYFPNTTFATAPTSVTNSDGAMSLVGTVNPGGAGRGFHVYHGAVTGSTTTITVTYGSSAQGCAIAAWSLVGASASAPTITANNSGNVASSYSLTVTVPANGLVLAMGMTYGFWDATAGFTAGIDTTSLATVQWTTNRTFTGGYKKSATLIPSHTITWSTPGNGAAANRSVTAVIVSPA